MKPGWLRIIVSEHLYSTPVISLSLGILQIFKWHFLLSKLLCSLHVLWYNIAQEQHFWNERFWVLMFSFVPDGGRARTRHRLHSAVYRWNCLSQFIPWTASYQQKEEKENRYVLKTEGTKYDNSPLAKHHYTLQKLDLNDAFELLWLLVLLMQCQQLPTGHAINIWQNYWLDIFADIYLWHLTSH